MTPELGGHMVPILDLRQTFAWTGLIRAHIIIAIQRYCTCLTRTLGRTDHNRCLQDVGTTLNRGQMTTDLLPGNQRTMNFSPFDFLLVSFSWSSLFLWPLALNQSAFLSAVEQFFWVPKCPSVPASRCPRWRKCSPTAVSGTLCPQMTNWGPPQGTRWQILLYSALQNKMNVTYWKVLKME